MIKYISSSTCGFYIEGVNTVIPEDAVEINDELYEKLKAADSRLIAFDAAGFPFLKDSYEIDPELLRLAEVQWRDAELKLSDYELNKVQDGDSKAFGTVADWRTYRKALRAYPESEGFPSVENRPVAPSNLG